MRPNYRSFLLRIWKTGESESPGWAASLEDPHTHQVFTFTSLEAVGEYLQQISHLPASDSEPNQGWERKPPSIYPPEE
mgnify:FL=1